MLVVDIQSLHDDSPSDDAVDCASTTSLVVVEVVVSAMTGVSPLLVDINHSDQLSVLPFMVVVVVELDVAEAVIDELVIAALTGVAPVVVEEVIRLDVVVVVDTIAMGKVVEDILAPSAHTLVSLPY